MFELDMADVKPSLLSWVVVGLMAVTFIAVAKWVLNRWTVPGLTELINSV
jgi:hypothetical protein